MSTALRYLGQRTILGVNFFAGSAQEAIARIRPGGLLVIPAAPALKNINCDAAYRQSLLAADLALADSALMVLVWNLIAHDHLDRLSGLRYLRVLIEEPDVKQPGNTLWVMPSPTSASTNFAWLASVGVELDPQHIYMAPKYGLEIDDQALLARIERLRPRHIILTLGGGTQERLGLFLKQHLTYLPAIHCVGAALAFLSGDQVHIPVWGDKLYLGWLIRCLSDPRRFVPRYWDARKLVFLILRYRAELPPLKAPEGRPHQPALAASVRSETHASSKLLS